MLILTDARYRQMNRERENINTGDRNMGGGGSENTLSIGVQALNGVLDFSVIFGILRVCLHRAMRLHLRLRQRYCSEFLHLHQVLSLRATVLVDFVYMS